MKSIVGALFVAVLLGHAGTLVGAEHGVERPFDLPTPDGWRTETLVFPLEFAPELKYEGLEELRFAPGMFEPEREDFWTYAFVWWISDRSVVNAKVLANDLEAYFAGLARAVSRDRVIDAVSGSNDVNLSPLESDAASGVDFVGTASIVDAFVTGENLLLNTRIKIVICPEEERLAVIFELSPQAYSHPVWSALTSVREGFQCPK